MEFTNYGRRCPSGVLPVPSPRACSRTDDSSPRRSSARPPGAKTNQSQDNAIAVATVPAAVRRPGLSRPTPATAPALRADLQGHPRRLRADGIPNTLDAGEGDASSTPRRSGDSRPSEVFVNATTGPSISSPAVDRAGNLYFFACVKLNRAAGPEFTTALPANRVTADNSTGRTVHETGEIVPGADSTRNYQVQYLGISDADSVEWAASASGNAVQQPLLGAIIGGRASDRRPCHARRKLVFRLCIVYDVGAMARSTTLPS